MYSIGVRVARVLLRERNEACIHVAVVYVVACVVRCACAVACRARMVTVLCI